MSSLDTPVMVEPVHHRRETTIAYYTSYAPRYDRMTSFERVHHQHAIQLAAIQDGEHILEVACGTGKATVDLARGVGPLGKVDALDLTDAMLQTARRKVQALGFDERVSFRTGNAQQLPYPNQTFDVLYNSYMFDLIAVEQFVPILTEFQRVLKPGGRLILLNMSKNRHGTTWFESVYRRGWVGACRPVLLQGFVEQAGFVQVHRIFQKSFVGFVPLPFGAEIVTACTPSPITSSR